ncbi:MAG: 23S rRNA (uracil(1939)-C(5))-methyltransferase RlmD [Candidatus Woesearchaeota archaeon]
METKCRYYGVCGGCSLQHLDYSVQLKKKRRLIESITNSAVLVFSGPEHHYRNRMDFIFNRPIGLRKRKNWKQIVDIEECMIADLRINKLLAEIRRFFVDPDSFNVKNHSGTLRYAVIRSADETSISFVLNSNSTRISAMVEQINLFSENCSAKNIAVAYVPEKTDMSVSEDYFVVKGKDWLVQDFLGVPFKYNIQGFFQNNPIVTEKMHKFIRDKIMAYKDTHLLDLYSGVGTFGIINSSNFLSTTLVENNPLAAKCAEENIKFGLNCLLVQTDASKIDRLPLKKPLTIIADPPRTGMAPIVISKINRLEPKAIVYVSCNPAQLAKDLKKLSGYVIKSVALFDMFPQTEHIECVVILEKN